MTVEPNRQNTSSERAQLKQESQPVHYRGKQHSSEQCEWKYTQPERDQTAKKLVGETWGSRNKGSGHLGINLEKIGFNAIQDPQVSWLVL